MSLVCTHADLGDVMVTTYRGVDGVEMHYGRVGDGTAVQMKASDPT